MRVAIAMSGEMRGCPDCLKLVEPQLIEPFRRLGAKVDLLICTRADAWWRPAAELPFRMLHVETNTLIDPSPIVSYVNPTSAGARTGEDRRAFLYQSYLQYYRSLATVGQMVARAEQQDGAPYNWVMRARPDCKLREPLDPSKLERGKINVPANDWWPHSDANGKPLVTLTDKFAIGPSDLMAVYFARMSYLHEFCLSIALHAEALVRWQLDRAGVPWCSNSYIHVLRDDRADVTPYDCCVRPDRSER